MNQRAPQRVLTAIGLMSGTSMDGVDAAIVRTDGERIERVGASTTVPYYAAFRARLRAALGKTDTDDLLASVVRDLTVKHADAVRFLMAESGLSREQVEVIGFHGHTILHRPAAGITRQIGDGDLLARLTGVPVVDDFRSNDVAHGGEGAPLAPLFHAALARDLEKPLAVLNVGGVANVTWIGADGTLMAFDTGPGNALIDDWMMRVRHAAFDRNGELAGAGKPDEGVLATLLAHPYFTRRPPKSLDRGDFALDAAARLSPADGAATVTAFTARAVARAVDYLPARPKRWIVCGGGRLNPVLMAALARALGAPVDTAERVGWNGDALEAQAFAYLAVRSLRGLPLSLPSTTGTREPVSGGRLHQPSDRTPQRRAG